MDYAARSVWNGVKSIVLLRRARTALSLSRHLDSAVDRLDSNSSAVLYVGKAPNHSEFSPNGVRLHMAYGIQVSSGAGYMVQQMLYKIVHGSTEIKLVQMQCNLAMCVSTMNMSSVVNGWVDECERICG